MKTLDLQNSPLDPNLQLVDFSKADADSLKELTEQALAAATDYLDKLEKDQDRQDCLKALQTIEEFDALGSEIDRYFGLLSHLNSVNSHDKIRTAHHHILPKLSAFGTKVGQSLALYQLYQTLHDQFDGLPTDKKTPAQKRAIDKALQGFILSGVALDDQKKSQFADIQSQLSLASAKFSDNVLDATGSYVRPLQAHELSGISQNGLSLLKAAADTYKAKYPDIDLPTDYVATLDIPMYLAVMQFADDRKLRQELYQAYSTRASDQGDNKAFDNSQIMSDIVRLRTQKANLLGMKDFSQYSLATKMADDSQQVEAFLLDIAKAARPAALAELQEMQAFAQDKLGLSSLEPWDMPYIAEKLRLEKFSLTSDELRPYFPLPVVLQGLFDICRQLFGIKINIADKSDYQAWHDDVLFCQVINEQDQKLLGGLYLDLFARQGKRGGAWLDDYQRRSVRSQKTTLPVGFIVGNFAPPVNDQPSQLSFDEVNTLFHEFGHALHHVLTEVDVSDVSGINGVEWDAVELPSQFMENFAITEEGIRKISRHITTQEALPEDKLQALIDAKNFQTGLQTLRQIEFGLFDLRLHSLGDTQINFDDILAILNQVRQEVSVVQAPAYNRFANSFSHIFSGGYACGYYSYMWAEVLSADAFGKFEEEGIYNAKTGYAFRQEILAKGGSRSAKENYQAFRGRPATSEALLRHRGLQGA